MTGRGLIRFTEATNGQPVLVAGERVVYVLEYGEHRRIRLDGGSDRCYVSVTEKLDQIEKALDLGYVPIDKKDTEGVRRALGLEP